jgi:uncharacterized membrane-anchored protein YhcB (DUF1043 family)
MSTNEMWGIVIISSLIAMVMGYVLGRRKAPGGQSEIKSLVEDYEQRLNQQQSELDAYKSQVHQHYDETATLFKDMAGSYKKMFDHLSVGNEKLGNLSEQRVLPERAGALLDGSEAQPAQDTNFVNPNQKGDEDALNR